MNAQEIKQGHWNTNTVILNGMYGSLAYHQEQWIILFCQMGFWFDHHSIDSCLSRQPPQRSAEPDITWFTKPVFSSHYSYLRPKMTWSNLQMDEDQICRHILTPQCVKWGFKEHKGPLTLTHLKLYLWAALGNLAMILHKGDALNTCKAKQNK